MVQLSVAPPSHRRRQARPSHRGPAPPGGTPSGPESRRCLSEGRRCLSKSRRSLPESGRCLATARRRVLVPGRPGSPNDARTLSGRRCVCRRGRRSPPRGSVRPCDDASWPGEPWMPPKDEAPTLRDPSPDLRDAMTRPGGPRVDVRPDAASRGTHTARVAKRRQARGAHRRFGRDGRRVLQRTSRKSNSRCRPGRNRAATSGAIFRPSSLSVRSTKPSPLAGTAITSAR